MAWRGPPEYLGQKGEENPAWKGDAVGYKGLHRWVRDHKPKPAGCEFCGAEDRRLEVANMDGKYSRDLETWRWLCRSCHLRHDNVAHKAWVTKRGR